MKASRSPPSKPRRRPARRFISGPSLGRGEKTSTRACPSSIWSGIQHTGRPRSRRLSPLLRSNAEWVGGRKYSLARFPLWFLFYFIIRMARLLCHQHRLVAAAARYSVPARFLARLRRQLRLRAACHPEIYYERKRTHTHSTHTYLQKPVKPLLQSFLLPSKNCVKFTTL